MAGIKVKAATAGEAVQNSSVMIGWLSQEESMDASRSSNRLRIAVMGGRGNLDMLGGVETHCKELYPRLVNKGHQVTVLGRKPYLPEGRVTMHGCDVVPVRCPRIKSIESLWASTSALAWIARRRHEFDVLHIHAIGAAILTPLVGLTGLPSVLTSHGPEYERDKWGAIGKSTLRLGERLGARTADAVIAISHTIQKSLDSAHGCESVYIPNGVNIPDRLPAGPFLDSLGIETGRYVLTAGRFVPEKGFHDLVEAFLQFETDWKLVIAGDALHEDNYSRSLKTKCDRYENVILPGYLTGAPFQELLSNAGLFVLPSYHEGLPIALLEAISYSLPILTSDIPSNSELSEPSERFRLGDIDDLAGQLAKRMALHTPPAAMNRLENEFNWDLVADATERVYFDVVKRARS